MNKAARYQQLLNDVPHIVVRENHYLTSLANLSAELKARFPSFSWVGFYLFDGHKLFLGPFQGLPACETIELSRGVCGASASTTTTIVVPDVHAFPGHIACDAGSRSEIVVPIVQNKRLIGVLDLDSYEPNNFDHVDQDYLERIVSYLIDHTNFPRSF